MAKSSKVVTNGAPRIKPPNAGKGRKKGVPNKTTASVKEALVLANEGLGGVPALIEWAKENRTEFYKLWGRMLPLDVAHSASESLEQLLAQSWRA